MSAAISALTAVSASGASLVIPDWVKEIVVLYICISVPLVAWRIIRTFLAVKEES